MAIDTTTATITPAQPKENSALSAAPTATTSATNANTSRAERSLFRETWSYRGLPPTQNETSAGPLDASSVSKYSRCSNLNMRAMTTEGTVSIFVL